MITIEDKALSNYVIQEDHQGFKVTEKGEKAVLQRTSDLNSALRYIADCRLKKEGREGMSLREYTALKNKIISEMMEAQKEVAEPANVPLPGSILVDTEN